MYGKFAENWAAFSGSDKIIPGDGWAACMPKVYLDKAGEKRDAHGVGNNYDDLDLIWTLFGLPKDGDGKDAEPFGSTDETIEAWAGGADGVEV